MRKISLITLSVILSLTLCISSVISSFAEEGFEIPEIEEVAEEELFEVIEEEEVELYADASTAVCYVGEDEASRVYYDTLCEAIVGLGDNKLKTIHLMKNTTWEGHTYSGGYGIHHRAFVLEGHGYTVTLGQTIHVSLDSDFTLNDVTVNLNGSYSLLVGNNGKLTLGDKTVVKNANSDFYAIGLENRMGDGGSLTLLPGSKITGNKSNVLGIIYGGCAGTINIEGEITGNTSGVGAVRINSSGVTVNVGKNANITGNTSKNFVPLASTTFNVASDFEGTVGVSYGAAGDAIGNVAEGADVSGITLDGSSTIATNKDGVLTWETADETDARTAVCYIDENVAGKRYASIHEAINAATSGSTIYVTKDITWDNVTTYWSKNITITSAEGKKKITMPSTANLRFSGCIVTLKNITLDFNFNGKNLQVEEGSTVTLVGADVINGMGGVGGTVIVGSTSGGGHLVMDGNSTLSGRATNSDGNVGGVVHLHGTGNSKFTMNGGKIINFDAIHNAVSHYSGTGAITISGNATIINGTSNEATPVTGVKNAIRLRNASGLTLKGDFTGDIKVNYGGLGDTFGAAEEGATITGSLLNYSTGTPGIIKDGSLIWDYACYIGTDTAANRKYSLNEALRGTTAKTVYLVRDAEWVPHEDSGVKAIANLTAVVNGNGYTLKPSKQLLINVNVDLTFENVTVDLNGYKFYYQSASKLTLNNGAHIINGTNTGGQGGAITMYDNKAVVITMNEGSSIKNSSATYGGAIRLVAGASLIMNGGEISGNQATVAGFGGGIYAISGSTITVSGNAKIEGNRSGADWNTARTDNLLLSSTDMLTVNSGFTGHIGIWNKTNTAEGNAIAVAGDGLTSLSSVESITNDSNAYHFGWIDAEGNIIWQVAPSIAPTLQYGTYAEGTKGIIRFTNSFESAPASAKITAFGTYVLDNSSFSESDMEASDNKFFKTEQSVSASGKSFITDLHTGNLSKSYTASSFCYIEGIDAPVFVTTTAEAINSRDGVIELSDEAVSEYESLYEN